MLISLAWLSDWLGDRVDPMSVEKIAEQLTLQGLEVEGVMPATKAFNNVVVGEVVELEAHPDADKLRVAQVNIGQDELVQIVCGAPNIKKGGRYPAALVGAVLPGDFKIKASELRGVPSNGMLCARDELGLLDEKNKGEGLMTLPEDAPVGEDFRNYLQLDDEIIEVAITPDRGDAFSYRGIARDILAGLEQSLPELSDIAPELSVTKQSTDVSVKVEAEEACPFYLAQKITGVDNTSPTPHWLVERLRRAGIRSISPIVDVTNYVMLHLGTPLHAFDSNVIGDEIVVRMSNESDAFSLIDNKEVKGHDDLLLIASPDKPLALAGIMGGSVGEVSAETVNVTLESAWFSPNIIAGKGRRFGLTTDASQRYERGVDFKLQEAAARLAIKLIVDICGGEVEPAVIAESEVNLPKREALTLTGKKLDSVLGARFPKRRIETILSSLGFGVEVGEKHVYQVTPPSHRFDILDEVDLIGELARLWGYEQIADVPCTNEFVSRPILSDDADIHIVLPRLGYSEAITYSFVDEKWLTKFGELFSSEQIVRLKNPISSEMNVMRTSLIPSLVSTLQYNLNRQAKRVKLYEVGHQYRTSEDEFEFTSVLAGLAYGEVKPLQWGYKPRFVDFFDVKGDVETLIESLGIEKVSFVPAQRDFLHPGQTANIIVNEKIVGFVGALHPRLQADIGIEQKIFVFELNREELKDVEAVKAEVISKFPTVRRDIAVQVRQSVNAGDLLTEIQSVCGDTLLDVTLFDVYVGRNIPRGTKSMAFALHLSDQTQTLTDEMADNVMSAVTKALSDKFNAELRS